MRATTAFATTLPRDLARALNDVCRLLGLRKNHIVESALREKLEDLIDAHDLDGAIREATAFYDWKSVKRDLRRKRRL